MHAIDALDLTQALGEGQGLQNVLFFEIFIVREDLWNRHTRAQPLKNRFDRVTQPANAGLPVADLRVDGDAIEHVESLA